MIIPLAPALRVQIESMAQATTKAPLHPRASRVLAQRGAGSMLSRQFAELLAQAGLREKTAHQGRAKHAVCAGKSMRLAFTRCADMKDWFGLSVSGPNHCENHLVALQRLERMRLLCWHENHLAALHTMKLAGDRDFDFALQHLD